MLFTVTIKPFLPIQAICIMFKQLQPFWGPGDPIFDLVLTLLRFNIIKNEK